MRPRPVRLLLHREPQARSSVVAIVTSPEMLDAAELAHRWLAANVYSRTNGWNRVRLRDGRSGWISGRDSGEFHPFEGLIGEHWNEMFFTAEWDGTLVKEPGSTESVAIPHDPRRRIVGYLEGVGPTVRVEAGPAADKIQQLLNGSDAASIRRSDGARFIEFTAGTEVPVFAEPTAGSNVVAHVKNHWGGFVLEMHESRVIVFSRRPGWFEVGLHDPNAPYGGRKLRRVWVEDRPDVWRFEVPEQVDADGFAFPWANEEEHAITVLDRRTVAGRLWLQVQVMLDSPCIRLVEDITDPPTVLAEGWVPAHNSRGQPMVWWETYCD